MNGGTASLLALLRRDRRRRSNRACFEVGEHRVGFRLVGDLDVRAAALLSSFASNSGGIAAASRAVMFQYSSATNLSISRLAIADQLQRDRLHAPGAQPAADLVPEERADLVADEPIEDAARLLRVDHLLVDLGGMLERREHALLGDLVEHQAADLLPVARAELLGQVPADRLAFAVGVGRDEDLVGRPSRRPSVP